MGNTMNFDNPLAKYYLKEQRLKAARRDID
jgi:hypothetical protein